MNNDEPTIITHHEYPPIPYRGCDWLAYYKDEEELGHYGWGFTREQAIEDLKLNYEPNNL